MAHLVYLAGIDFVDFPFFFVNLVQYAALHAGLVFLAGLPAATCTGAAVVFDALLREFAATLLIFLFQRFSVAQLVFLMAGALEEPPLHHVGEELLESHLLFFRKSERSAELAPDHRFVTEYSDNLFFTR